MKVKTNIRVGKQSGTVLSNSDLGVSGGTTDTSTSTSNSKSDKKAAAAAGSAAYEAYVASPQYAIDQAAAAAAAAAYQARLSA